MIWADAICINKGDAVEKTAQIALMGAMCNLASSVILCWGKWMKNVNKVRAGDWCHFRTTLIYLLNTGI